MINLYFLNSSTKTKHVVRLNLLYTFLSLYKVGALTVKINIKYV